MINVDIAYVKSDKTEIYHTCHLPQGATVNDALTHCGMLAHHPEIAELNLGIFAKPATVDTLLHEGDRIEIYRPLYADPKEKRRQQAKRA